MFENQLDIKEFVDKVFNKEEIPLVNLPIEMLIQASSEDMFVFKLFISR